MLTPDLFRAKAAHFGELAKTANSPDEVRELRRREQSFLILAENEQWLADHRNQTVHARWSDDGGATNLAAEPTPQIHAGQSGAASQ